MDRYATALIQICARRNGSLAELLLAAGILASWTYQRMLKRKLRVKRRAVDWMPNDRVRLGLEIMHAAIQSEEWADCIRSKFDEASACCTQGRFLDRNREKLPWLG
ncbi:hypothetical protein ACFO0A_14085 [Novosphingobium tardum]|uniref:Uncharacterized protein n=1 Tax=Novosphingobium tardum TaxID=1538021 RepID=A0ABV8RU30_9SPHN